MIKFKLLMIKFKQILTLENNAEYTPDCFLRTVCITVS